jgi:carbamoyltransferase
VDSQLAHAAYAFHSSPFDDAIVVVCDSETPRGWTVWRGSPAGLEAVTGDFGHFPIAATYSQLTEAFGFAAGQQENIVEALARVGGGAGHAVAEAFDVADAGLSVHAGWREHVGDHAAGGASGTREQVAIAGAVQTSLGAALVALLERIHRATGAADACLTGGLFYNTYFTTTAAAHGPFRRVFVPAHPGNGGCAIGATLAVSPRRPSVDVLSSAFLGPGYSLGAVKATLDNCKLSYTLLGDDKLLDAAVDALGRGWLVGCFDGRMEWGPRALGPRSVLASPKSEHVLDNLNGFLKKRPWYRAYGVSVPQRKLAELFDGPPSSPYMQFEYTPKDPDRFRSLLPPGATRSRVHTVDDSAPRLLRLLELWEQQTGLPMLVNTSFNGFHEPMVCSPRDAVRVFYGTGLDVMLIENFLLKK